MPRRPHRERSLLDWSARRACGPGWEVVMAVLKTVMMLLFVLGAIVWWMWGGLPW
jgi:hypothetical protein